MELRFPKCRLIMDFGFPAMLALIFLQQENTLIRHILLVCLIHELGHGIVMYLTKAGIREIRFYAAGMQMRTNTCLLGNAQILAIYLSGPVINLLFAVLLRNCAPVDAFLHFSIGIFNLLPYRILDGGAALECILETRTGILQFIRIFCMILSIAVIFLGYSYKIHNPSVYLMAIYLAFSEISVDKCHFLC